jgi:arylsulfatase A-like enzyme
MFKNILIGKSMLGIIPFISFAGSCTGGDDGKKPDRPNIILIMADDMGFSDPGFMGSSIATPNIDMLAQNGLLFNQFYNTSRCCPTRASLLTGLYAHQTGMGWMTASDLGHPGYTGDLNRHCVTIAEVLKPAGYDCYVTGKWHVTHDKYMRPEGPKHNWPLQRGFDKFYGHLSGGGGYYRPDNLVYDDDFIEIPEDFYLTTAVTDSTVRFLDSHFKNKKDTPLFFYVSYYAPHRPLHALPGDIARYRGKFMDGWDVHRNNRLEKLYETGIADPATWRLTRRDQRAGPWDDLTSEEKDIWDARMAIYAAQIDVMDRGIGEIIESLKKHDQLHNTLIIFLSDNGGCDEFISAFSLNDLTASGNKNTNASYGPPWSNVSNTPFREHKSNVHEGGIATPLILYWPSKIKNPGEITTQVGHVIDLLPTFTEITGARYPAQLNGSEIHPMAGKSLYPVFYGEVFDRGPIYFEHQADRAVRDGDWKLVSPGNDRPPYTGDWELYDLSADRTETNNLASEFPSKVDQLSRLWDQWALDNSVYPLDGRGWNQKVSADRLIVPTE